MSEAQLGHITAVLVAGVHCMSHTRSDITHRETP